MYTIFHMLCYKKEICIVCQKGMTELQTLCVEFDAVEIITFCYIVMCGLSEMGLNLIDFCSNLVLV
jgi:hypothetical protein